MSAIPQKKPTTFSNHNVEGFHDLFTLVREKWGVKIYTNFWTPCIFTVLQGKYQLHWLQTKICPDTILPTRFKSWRCWQNVWYLHNEDSSFQLTFYLPNCGPNVYKDCHVNDSILMDFAQNHENLYLGVDSNVFKYRLERNAIMVFEVYQEGNILWIYSKQFNDCFLFQLFSDEEVRIYPYAVIRLTKEKSNFHLVTNEASTMVRRRFY